ncbi:methyl-accepting chemotaxis protein, partial [Vibrio cholerae]
NEMANIERISRQIDKIVDGISNVSIQTAMLAVNGAVEAARAGEYGKGFAVVSTDIQNLANDAAENAEQIKDQVKNIQEQINIVRKDLADILSTVMEEAQKAALTIKQLNNVRSGMNDVVLGSKRIAESAEGIERSITDARSGMQQIATAAEESSHATGEAATAARQQSSSTSELASAIENIAAVADELQSI